MNTASEKNSKSRRNPHKTAWLFAMMLAGLVFAGCASQGTAPESKQESIAQRAQSRWDALLAGDFETAYSYYSPGYRSTASVADLEIAIRLRRVRWTSAEYQDHSCSENSCTVRFQVGYTVVRPVPGLDKWDGGNDVDETWIKTDGEWWYLPKK